jgi:hypothetical protein
MTWQVDHDDDDSAVAAAVVTVKSHFKVCLGNKHFVP